MRVFDIQPYLLPAPSAIASTLGDNWDRVVDAMLVTGANALVGLVLGVICGVALSFVLMRYPATSDFLHCHIWHFPAADAFGLGSFCTLLCGELVEPKKQLKILSL